MCIYFLLSRNNLLRWLIEFEFEAGGPFMNGVQKTVIYEQAMDLNFLDEIYKLPGGEKIKDRHSIAGAVCAI